MSGKPNASPTTGPSDVPAQIWHFGPASLDEATLELRVGGEILTLERKSIEVLNYLLRHAGEVVTKDELLESIWPGRVLSESSVAKCISKIREAVGDREQRIVKTVHGYGYRLVAPVRVEAAGKRPPASLSLGQGERPPLRPHWVLAERLGSGAHGEVWLARHAKTRQERVYKFALDGRALTSLKREITLYRYMQDTLCERADLPRVIDWNLEQTPYFVELECAGARDMITWAETQGGLQAIALPQRLELVAKVADALAAAHSVGVLHKDLKPANVLVTETSQGTAQIRLSDFGSGGVLDPAKLSELGITRLGFTQTVRDSDSGGTPLYAAPEILAEQPFTVQSDIYALGVMLFQLAVGDLRRPLAPGWEHELGDELLREDIAAAAAGDPARRPADAAHIAERLRGLDQRRIARAEQRAAEERSRQARLALDRLRARRLWVWSTVGVLMIGVLTTSILYFQAESARQDAARSADVARAVSDFLNKDLLEHTDLRRSGTKSLTVQQLLERASGELQERFADQPEVKAEVHLALARGYAALGHFARAAEQSARAVPLLEESQGADSDQAILALWNMAKFQMASHPGRYEERRPVWARVIRHMDQGHQLPQINTLWPRLYQSKDHLLYGNYGKAIAVARTALKIAQEKAIQDGTAVSELEQVLGRALAEIGELSESEQLLRQTIVARGKEFGEDSFFTATARLDLARTLIAQGTYEDAESILLDLQGVYDTWFDEDHYLRSFLLLQFANLRLEQHRPTEAGKYLERALGLCTGNGGCAPYVADAIRTELAIAYKASGKLDKAEQHLRDALASTERIWGTGHGKTARPRIHLADLLRQRGELASAWDQLRAVPLPAQRAPAPPEPVRAELHRLQGLLWLAEGEPPKAEAALRDALRMLEGRYGARHWRTEQARRDLASASGVPAAGEARK